MSSFELRRLGDTALRSRASPLLPFLAPSIPSVWLLSQTACQIKHAVKERRSPLVSHFSTSTRKYADPTSTKADLEFLNEYPQKRRDNKASKTDTIEKPDNVDNILGNILGNIMQKQSSYTDMRKSYQSERKQGGEIIKGMAFPDEPRGNPGQEILNDINQPYSIMPRNKRTVRSRPTVGRTIELDPSRGIDFGKAWRQLGMLCAQNRVRADLKSQRFHERPGLKRKRLKQERWRKLFKAGFEATVERVQEMRRKGW